MRSARKRTDNTASMGFLDHIAELRRRLIGSFAAALAGSIAAYLLFDAILAWLLAPFAALRGSGDDIFYIHAVAEGFLIRVRISVVAGVVISSPVHFYNVVRFVFPGLTARERRIVSACSAAGLLLAVLGGYYGYFRLIPISVSFLTDAGFIPRGVGLLLNYQSGVLFLFRFLFGSLVLFQIPLVLELLLALGLVKRRALLRSTRYVIVAIFVVSAVVTPPDFVSQLGLAVPLIALHFLVIGTAKLFHFGDG